MNTNDTTTFAPRTATTRVRHILGGAFLAAGLLAASASVAQARDVAGPALPVDPAEVAILRGLLGMPMPVAAPVLPSGPETDAAPAQVPAAVEGASPVAPAAVAPADLDGQARTELAGQTTASAAAQQTGRL